MLYDLLWADPTEAVPGWIPSDRGKTFSFGPMAAELFCAHNKVRLIVRSHQVVDDGYQFNSNGGVLTVFGVPWYKGSNHAALVCFDEDGMGNGIVERCHRSVKVIAARKGCSISEAVYLYNVTPRDDCSASSTPAAAVYWYDVRIREVHRLPEEDQLGAALYVGQKVWVKPTGARCVSRYHRGTVTGIPSRQAVMVDVTPRHVRDLRHRAPSDESCKEEPPKDDEYNELVLHFTLPEAQSTLAEDEPLTMRLVRVLEKEPVGMRRSSRPRRARRCTCCDT
uniref:Serine/threonine specific protein phosphatases domain-containing protein n=1 Tax=Trichuris muris TaxID=70415 RepID=A0A5S6QXX6_TRIMR